MRSDELLLGAGILVVVGFVAYAATTKQVPGRSIVALGGQAVPVELAITDEEQQQGLSGRKLARGHGLLFLFPEERPVTMHMAGVTGALDIVFIDRFGVVTGVARGLPYDPSPISAAHPAKYVLELNADDFDVHVGDHLVLAT